MKTVIETKMIAWLRGLVCTATLAGCALASAQNYLVQPSAHYRSVSMGAGEGVGLGQGSGAEGAGQNGAPIKDDLFQGTQVFEKNATGVTEINMGPDSLDMVSGEEGHKARNMVLNVVRTYTYDKPGMYNMADVEEFRNKLNTGGWHCSVHVRDLKNGTGSDVCNKGRTDGMRETAIIEVGPKQLTFIHTIRKGGPGTSDLGYFPMLPGLGPTAMIAMTNPEALADMQEFPMMLNMRPDLRFRMDQLKVHPFNEQQMKALHERMKNLKPQMDEMKRQMKELNKDLYKDKSPQAPAAPAAPQAAPAPAPPQAPE